MTTPYEVPAPRDSAAGQQVTAGKPLIVTGIVALAVGVVLGIVSFILLVSGVVGAVGDQLSAPLHPYPGSASVTLEPGSYAIFVDQGAGRFVSADEWTIQGPGGQTIAADTAPANEESARGGEQFIAVATFEAPQAGTYLIESAPANAGDIGGTFFVARSFVGSFTDRAWWGLGVAPGGLLVVVGVILLAVGLTQRRKARQALAPAYPAYPAGGYYAQPTPGGSYGQPAPSGFYGQPAASPAPAPTAAAAPPGWYPDPGRPGGRRYWDGTRWTDHTT
jgi:hypothetical protein